MEAAKAAPPDVSPRLARLRARIFSGLGGGHKYIDPAEERGFAAIVGQAASASQGQPQVLRSAIWLEHFATQFPAAPEADELLVGHQRFSGGWRQYLPAGGPGWQPGHLAHMVVDYGRLLRLGVDGLQAELDRNSTPPESTNRQAFRRALAAFSRFIARHAAAARAAGEDAPSPARRAELAAIAAAAERLAHQPPQSFPEALQLTWFAQIFLSAESGGGAAISFGRLDQYLWPFMREDLAAGQLDEATAREWLGAFWLKCCEGGESQAVTLGGVDEAGAPADNPLSCLCLEVARELRVWQPSVAVRLGPANSTEFRRLALELCQQGDGQPTFLNDPVVIRSLQAAGLPLARARDWATVGCYEAVPQGDANGRTVAAGFSLIEELLAYLAQTGEPADYPAFEAGFLAWLERRAGEWRADWARLWESRRETQAAPFESLLTRGCRERGLTCAEGGADYNLFGVNILGLGTIVDSLRAIEKLVYGERLGPLAELRAQLAGDWPDARWGERAARLPGKHGTDDKETNQLVSSLSRRVAELVLAEEIAPRVRPYPGFFWFFQDIRRPTPATPDGRRANQPVSYGVGPGPLAPAGSPTTVLNSAAGAAHELCACGNPLLLSLNRSEASGPAGQERLGQLIATYFAAGGFHLHFNLIDARILRAAQGRPREHESILIRVSGFSAQFIALDTRLQDTLIARTEQGV